MTGRLAGAIELAVEEARSPNHISAIKTVVSNFLRASDPSMRIQHTEYFNHSFAPDLVVSWPREKKSRLVYLRANANPNAIMEDVRTVAAAHPIVFSLESRAKRPTPAVQRRVDGAATEANVLVTDSDAIEAIVAPRAPIANVLANAMLRGGRGYVDERRADGLTRTAIRGFDGAKRLDLDTTRAAVVSTRGVLDNEQSGRMTRIIQAIWEGQGGDFSDLREPAAGGPLTEGDLQLLFDSIDSTDHAFWRHVGRSVRFDQIVRLELAEGTPSLDTFIAANSDVLLARAVRVLRDEPVLFGREGRHWFVHRGCLAYKSEGWSAYFASREVDLPTSEESVGIPVYELVRSASALGLRLVDVQVQREPQFVVSIESVASDADVANSPDFGQWSDRPGTFARRASIEMPSGRALTINFVRRSAAGHTHANFQIAEIGSVALSMLVGLDELDFALLGSYQADLRGTDGQPSFFDDDSSSGPG